MSSYHLQGSRKAPFTIDPVKERGLSDVLLERRRQVEVEGWTPEHDDTHTNGELALASRCYAWNYASGGVVPGSWPWDASWWKPKDRRSNLVKAAALLVAEIDRIDRQASTTPGEEPAEQATQINAPTANPPASLTLKESE